eukprot:CAMPEP_0167817610 /NCGR_PEP_ID=MMETSP0112_2-20121227/4296_1 /TAXON_ID=91324 /ORGANISM="Lotharella globosa, Strain CCCM811" /LENGTH=192 /DNA_ID=CAMNT_0007717405 /DNA_START=15 /DNA_END=593 /DNA_ORIENTATION=-
MAKPLHGLSRPNHPLVERAYSQQHPAATLAPLMGCVGAPVLFVPVPVILEVPPEPCVPRPESKTSVSESSSETVAKVPKKRRRRKRRKKSPGAPKHPSSAFLFFSRANGALAYQPENFNEHEHWMTTLSRIWKDMPGEEKKPYVDLCAKDKERYAEEMKTYQRNKTRKSAPSPAVDAPHADEAWVSMIALDN